MVAGDTSKKNVENIQTRIAEKRLTSTGRSGLMTCLIVYEQVEAAALLLSLGVDNQLTGRLTSERVLQQQQQQQQSSTASGVTETLRQREPQQQSRSQR
jgi:hypothetical protein